jgi:tagatose-1,6-bisphosphate aldolase non-catalytic subunit AgaZ/GatZ
MVQPFVPIAPVIEVSAKMSYVAWARKRVGRSVAHLDKTMEKDDVPDRLMQEYLDKHGIRPR